MNASIHVGDRMVDAIPPDDRGFAYGDGLFETMRVHLGDVPWWDAHWARLCEGGRRLRIALPDPVRVRHEVAALFGATGEGVARLVVSRGGGGRGYAPPATARPTWVLSRHDVPPPPRPGGLAVRWCTTRLASQPALAGIKHCNRLEQVLARSEWDDPGIDEGLMRDADGDAVCATAANLFALVDGAWATPPVERCGVAGVCRGWLLANADVRVRRLSVRDVEQAQAVFLCNAARGILPVARLGDREWRSSPQVAALQRGLAKAHPAFVPDPEAP